MSGNNQIAVQPHNDLLSQDRYEIEANFDAWEFSIYIDDILKTSKESHKQYFKR